MAGGIVNSATPSEGVHPERQPCYTAPGILGQSLIYTHTQQWIILSSNRLIYQPFEAMFVFNCHNVTRLTNRLVPVKALHRNLSQKLH